MANEINQIKVGSTTYTLQDSRVDSLVTGVSSVNSKTGDVSLAASDVGALPISGGTIAGTSGDTPLYIKSAHATASYEGFQRTDGTTLGYFGYSSKDTPAVYLSSGAKTIYHTGNLPTIPTVNNGTLTIQKNGTSVGTFTANQSGNTTANITVPTTASDVGALPSSGGNVSGHIYLTGAKESSSTGNTSQIVFGTSSNNHVAVSSNTNALVINPTTSTTTNQIVLYLDKASVFPNGITGTASNATKLNGQAASYYATKDEATTSAAGLMSAADKTIINRFTYDYNTPQLYIDAGACQIDMNDDAIYISAAGGLYYDGNEVAVKSELWNLSDRIAAGTGNRSVTIGYGNTVNGSDSVAIGYDNEVGSDYSFAAGTSNTASGLYSSAFGRSNVASGSQSTAIGYHNTASGSYSLAAGYYNTAGAYQTVIGRRATTTYTGPTSTTSTAGSLFIIGKGTGASALSNAFRVMTTGAVYGAAAYNSSGADYAEMWEWADGNPDNEDRRGKFVTVDENNKIRIATTDDDYILGIISATPCVVGDVQSENWREMYLKDVFGQPIVKKVDVPEHIDEETGELVKAHTEEQWVLNPEYDPTRPYVSRDERKEWAAVGLMGKLVVIDDGTCVAGRYCKLTGNGTATSSTDKNDWRVLKRMDSTHVQILYR